MKIAFEGKIDLPRAEQLLESKGLGLNGPVQQFHTKNVLRRIQKYMPYRTGATIKLPIAQTDIHEPYIVTDTVYAKRLFNGMTAAENRCTTPKSKIRRPVRTGTGRLLLLKEKL